MLLYAAISKISCLLENISPINPVFLKIAHVRASSRGPGVTLLVCKGRKHRATFAFARQIFWEDLRLHLLQQQVSGYEDFVCKSFSHLYLCQAVTNKNVQFLCTFKSLPQSVFFCSLSNFFRYVYTTNSTAIPMLKWHVFCSALEHFSWPELG